MKLAVNVNLGESIARGYDSPWTTWRCLNRLHTGFTCRKEQRQKCGYFKGDAACACGLTIQNTADMMQCTLLARACTRLIECCTNCIYKIPAPRHGGQILFFGHAGRRSLPPGWLCSSQKWGTSSQIMARPHTQTNTLQ